MIGTVRIDPNQPVLSTVKVPPWRSSSRSLFDRARAARSWMARLMPLIESWSASWMTGTIRPFVDGDGDADVDPPLPQQAFLGVVGVEVGVAVEGLDHGLDHERQEAQPDSLARLVGLGLLARAASPRPSCRPRTCCGPPEWRRRGSSGRRSRGASGCAGPGPRPGRGPRRRRRTARDEGAAGARPGEWLGDSQHGCLRDGRRDGGLAGRSGGSTPRGGFAGSGGSTPRGPRRGDPRQWRLHVPWRGSPARSTNAITSSRVIRPACPVPTIWTGERPCSRISSRTAGVIRASGSPAAVAAIGTGGRTVTGAGAAGAGAAGAGAAGAGAVGLEAAAAAAGAAAVAAASTGSTGRRLRPLPR